MDGKNVTNQAENGTSTVNIGNVPGNSNEQVIAQALSTFAIQLPTTIQTSIRNSMFVLCVAMFTLFIIIGGFIGYCNFVTMNETKEIHALYRKMDDRHKRIIQYAKEHDYRILTKEEREQVE